jgi:prevent-host-death family protein
VLLRNGVHINRVSAWLGHHSAGFTLSVYSHLMPDDEERVASGDVEEGRRTLGEVVDLARLAGEPTMITRNNKPAAVVVSADWYQMASESLDSAGDGPATGREATP